MMKNYSTMSLAESQDEKEHPLQDMKMELHSKGAVLTNAWSDLLTFLTKYQSELTRKEYAVEVAEKEADFRKKQLEEMKPMFEFDHDVVSNIQHELRTKESQINHLQSELLVKEQLVQKMELDLKCNEDRLDKSRNDFLAEHAELLQYKGNLEKLQSELSVKQEQIEIKDILFKKMQGQLMSENADLKEQLELERSAKKLTKKSMEEKSTPLLLEQSGISEPQQIELENTSSAKSRKLKSLLTGKTAFTVTALGTAPGTSVISTTDVPQKKARYSTRSTCSGLNQESDSINIPTTSGSEVYFPLSVSGESGEVGQESKIDTVSEMFSKDRELKSEHFDMQPGTPSSGSKSDTDIMDTPEDPVPVSGPIPHYRANADNSKEVGDKEKTIFPGYRKKASKSKDKAESYVMCDMCGKTMSNHRYLNEHKAQVHGIGKCLICEVCGKALLKPCQYRDHVNAHKGIKEHQCPDCKQSFCFQTSLNRHIQEKICKSRESKAKIHKDQEAMDDDDEEEEEEDQGSTVKVVAKVSVIAPCHQCHNCGKMYRSNQALKYHMSSAHGEGKYEFQCTACQKQFFIRSLYEDHMDSHNSIKRHTCRKCGKTFTYRESRDKHQRSNHIESKKTPATHPFICKMCGASFTETRNLNDHVRGKHGMGLPNYSCDRCGKCFNWSTMFIGAELNVKIEVEDVEVEETEVEDVEVEETEGEEEAKYFNSLRNDEKNDLYMCDRCGKILGSKNSLVSHKASTHGEGRAITCDICNQHFFRRGTYNDHRDKHAGIRRHPCNGCNAKFTYKTALTRHIQTCRSLWPQREQDPGGPPKNVACTQCSRKFTSKKNLHEHFVGMHEKRSYPCEICGKVFRQGRKGKYANAPKIFACDQCDQAYSTKTSLSQHINGMHGRKTYYCLVCRKDFRWRSTFNKHKLKHSTSPN